MSKQHEPTLTGVAAGSFPWKDGRTLTNIVIVLLATLVAALICYPLLRWNAPVVTIYMRQDCSTCRAWKHYLDTQGFRTRLGAESDWPALRARFRLPPGFRGRHTAVVEGLLLEGHVPADAIRAMLAKPDHSHVRGLVVPGIPDGAPGLFSFAPQPYVVYAVLDSGLMRPLGDYQHSD